MQASDYIRSSDAAQAMTKYCREQGWTWAVAPPGSKGHPFLVVTANGTRFKQPFSLTPSDKKRAALNAVRDLKRAAYEAGAIDEPQEANVNKPVNADPIIIRKTSTGAPVLPDNAHLKTDGTLAGGMNPVNKAYSRAVNAYIAKRIKQGASVSEMAQELRGGGAVMDDKCVTQRCYALRRQGQIKASWTPNGGPSMATPPAAPALIEESPNPIEAKPDLRPALNGRFGELVTDALCSAREKSAADADEMAARWIEQIAKARGEAERRACERRYERVLEVLTS